MNRPPQLAAKPNSAADGCGFLGEALSSLWTALWHARLLGMGTNVGALLPPVSPAGAPAKGNSQEIIRRIDRIVRVLVFWRRQRCFYRSFVAACVLRRRGVPAKLNFGLQILGARRKRCHCWITIEGQSLAERGDPLQDYPVPLGQWQNDVYYWLAAQTTTSHHP